MFLLPGIISRHVRHKDAHPRGVEDRSWHAYLWNRADKADGGWGIHIEGCSTVFGTALNYTVLRLVGVPADHSMMVKARGTLHKLGGATAFQSWGKLCSLSSIATNGGNEPHPAWLWCWLLPNWLPIHPWRWWIHTRMVYIPMGYLWGRKFKAEMDPLIASLREELYVQPYESIKCRHRGALLQPLTSSIRTPRRSRRSWLSSALTTTATSLL